MLASKKYKSICVTGGSGTMGRNIPYGYKISSKDCDLRDPAQVELLFKNNKFDAGIFLGAAVGGLGKHLDPNSRYELLFDNMAINLNSLHFARKYNVRRVLSYLSSCVFSDSCKSPYTEEMIYEGSPSRIHESYAHAKRLLCAQSQIIFDEGYDFSTLIPVNLFGPQDDFVEEKSHVIASLILKAYRSSETGEAFVVWGAGKAVRNFTYVKDMAEITTFLLDNYYERSPIIVCAPDSAVEIGAVASLIADEFGVKNKLTFDKSKPEGQKYRVLSGNKLASIIKYPFTPLEQAIKQTCDWFKKSYPNVRL